MSGAQKVGELSVKLANAALIARDRGDDIHAIFFATKPMIETFAFHRAKLWCPWCGAKEGMFHGLRVVDANPALDARAAEDMERSRSFFATFLVRPSQYVQ